MILVSFRVARAAGCKRVCLGRVNTTKHMAHFTDLAMWATSFKISPSVIHVHLLVSESDATYTLRAGLGTRVSHGIQIG